MHDELILALLLTSMKTRRLGMVIIDTVTPLFAPLLAAGSSEGWITYNHPHIHVFERKHCPRSCHNDDFHEATARNLYVSECARSRRDLVKLGNKGLLLNRHFP